MSYNLTPTAVLFKNLLSKRQELIGNGESVENRGPGVLLVGMLAVVVTHIGGF